MYSKQKLSDEEFVSYICRKDKGLYSEVIKRYQQRLMRYVVYLIGDKEQAKDVVQETFIKAYINLNGFNPKKKFASWIYRIAHNEVMNSLNKNKKYLPIDENLDIESGTNIEDDFSKKELRDAIHNCIDQIPTFYKEPLILYFSEDKSYEEISDILRLPIGTVGVRIKRAKILMKKICQKLRK